ncbi:hypothetical protein NDU88_005228 [Pleurodeles waltl]|uniref:Uncharacterized protein n=1 Tax=Pleurodeles waltl TaxID=8319 RepID=A0AAV7TUU6_PLEWA|nr:hypothetical protein NDU88_005228 [Pleurodeles waltl]
MDLAADGESTVECFVIMIRAQACPVVQWRWVKFGTMAEELIRDQLIVQCRDRKIQERLWAAKNPTLQEAVDLAKVIEESQRCIKELERK